MDSELGAWSSAPFEVGHDPPEPVLSWTSTHPCPPQLAFSASSLVLTRDLVLVLGSGLEGDGPVPFPILVWPPLSSGFLFIILFYLSCLGFCLDRDLLPRRWRVVRFEVPEFGCCFSYRLTLRIVTEIWYETGDVCRYSEVESNSCTQDAAK